MELMDYCIAKSVSINGCWAIHNCRLLLKVDDQLNLTPYTKKSRGQTPGMRSNILDDWKPKVRR
ncbi:hypothetical protein HanRHA438_Chr01g0019141 [Helianthus annuus]|nr:hypothetical protein HanIR_Chr01g0020381 [Helianthus annuus]KAJ0947729.1 hypothetical protein HanRHA438_Chr01g0019141 [Helianthus annuus]